MHFSFNFAWDSIQLGFVHQGSGGGGGGSLLNGKNLLSMMKVIWWQSLKEKIAQTLTEIKNKQEFQCATWSDYKHHKHS